jgi:hypothetical protein
VIAAVLATALGALAQTGTGQISASGATVDKVGWWNKANAAPSNPAGVTVPAPPTIPKGSLAAGAQAGEPDKVTAIGILPDEQGEATVATFTLTLHETTSPGTQINGAAAKLVACPITSFWAGGENGPFDTVPEYDCTLAKAPGTRAPDGTWSFDLLAIGQLWFDPLGTVTADGVVIVEEVDAPNAFQTVFSTANDGDITVVLQVTPTGSSDDLLGGGFDDSAVGTDVGSFDSAGFDTGGGFVSPSIGSSDIPVGGLPAPAAPTTGDAAGEDTASPTPVAARSTGMLDNLPGGLVLMIPLVIALLALLSFTLGPAGEPVPVVRERGVSRALAARERAEADSRTALETP